jgi:tetratricopeptide (TPR) repeat protein
MALHGLDQALAMLEESRHQGGTPRLHALSWVQEAVVQVEAQDWRAALAAIDRVGDAMAHLTVAEQVAALINAGLAHLSLLQLEPARDALDRALMLATEHGLAAQEFKARHNLGCLEYYAGHLPEAIRYMRQADDMDAPVDRVRAQHDLARVLLEAGLLDQAREMLTRALGVARADGHRLQEADLLLDLATTALVRDDPAGARAHLDAAIAAYRTRGAGERQRSAALLRASVDVSEGVVPRGLDRLLQSWLEVTRPVTPDERLAGRVSAEAHLLRGEVGRAAYAVARLAGNAHQGFAAEMHERLLVAKVAAAQGDRARARRNVRSAMHRLTERQAPSQSLEIRAALALHGRRLADFDVQDALASGSAARVFDAVERWRAVSHRLPPVTTAADPEAAETLAQLRQARREGAEPGEQGAAARRRAAELEWQVSRLDWSRSEQDGSEVALAPTRHRTARILVADRGEQLLVMVAQAGDEYALTVTARGTRLHHLGPAPEIGALADRLGRDLRAQAFAATNPALATSVGRAVSASVEALDARLLAGLDLEDGPVVVVPGRTLMAVPWGMLPRLAGRPVTVAPSVTRWSAPLLAVGPAAAGGRLSVRALAGPRLRRATAEAEAVAGLWREAGVDVMAHAGASSEVVRDALARHDVVHVAAHGTHEPQSPWFSALHMADGPAFAHELPRRPGAAHVVLSACDVGRLDPRPGDEPLGLTAALLGLGVQSVVAPVAPVSDEAAAEAMVAYHRALATGRSASEALANTLTRHPAAGAFCLYGTDWRPGTGQIQSAGSRNIAS